MARSSTVWWRRILARSFASVSEALGARDRRRSRRVARSRLLLESLEERVVPSAAAWSGYAGDAQHTAITSVASQALDAIHWSTSVDLNPQYSGGELFIHYGSPVVTANNTVIVPVKTGASDGFEIEAFNGATGALKWTVTTDYSLPPHSWTPSYSLALTPTGRLYFGAAGGALDYIDNPDADNATITGQVAFYGNANHTSAEDSTVFINTPLTADANGNIFFGFQVTGSEPVGLQSGIARVAANGSGTWIAASTAASDGGITNVSQNSAPAVSNDGSHLYVAVNNGNGTGVGNVGYLLELNSTTLAAEARVFLLDPLSGNAALLPDLGTASPTVGPDGHVYMGVLDDPLNTFKGWMLQFSGDLSQEFTPGAFGWDDTVSIVDASLVGSYTGTSSYLLMTKYNNYAGIGTGDGLNKIAILDPNDTQIDSRTGATVMKEVLTILGPTPDDNGFPGAVREWCINSAVVDPFTHSVLANSEDGKLYRWDLDTNTFTQVITLTGGLGEAYTPTVIGADGTVYAIQDAQLFAVGLATGEITISGTGNFSAPAIYGAGNTPDSLAHGDFNGDGKADLVVANFFGGDISVLLNNGDGTFGAATNYATGGGPNGFAIADFNHDGKQDIAVANYFSGTVSVLLGNGNGTFQNAVNYAVGGGPADEMVVGDFNGDGELDLAVADLDSSLLSVLNGNGDGTFQTVVNYAAGSGATAVVAADMNNDGKLDLAVGNFNAGTVTVFLNNGTGTFAASTTASVGANPFYIEAGDFNGDGKTDLVTANSGDGTISVLMGTGGGALASAASYNVGSFPDSIAVADLNGDGVLDLAVGNDNSNDMGVLFGNEDGTFQSALSVSSNAGGVNGVTIADFNGDGKLDIDGADQNTSQVSVILGHLVSAVETQTFNGTVATFTTNNADAMAGWFTASINWGDGNTTDGIVSANGSGGFNVSGSHVYSEEGPYTIQITVSGPAGATASITNNIGVADAPVVATGSTFSPTEGASYSGPVATFTDPAGAEATTHYSASINWGDSATTTGVVTYDSGAGDFVVSGTHTYADEGSYSVVVTIHHDRAADSTANSTASVQDGALTATSAPFTTPATYAAGNTPDSAGTITLDDGTVALLIANFFGSDVTIVKGDGSGTFQTSTSIATGGGPNGFAVGDFNHDGHQDFAVANYFSNSISVLLGNGDGTFQTAVDYATGVNPADELALADFNGDGELDLAVGNAGDSTVSVLMGNSDGSFQNAVSYAAGPGADAVAAADFNNDGSIDLAVANLNDNSVTILTNDGAGNFTSGGTTSVGVNPFYIVAADFDHDGQVDVATANYSTNTISVLHNNGGGSFTRSDIVTGGTPDSLALGSFNGQLGLVVGNYGSNDFTLLFGRPDGSFFNAGNFPGGNGPNGIALDDFNGDGTLDVVVADQNGNTGTVLLNTMLQSTEGQAFSGVVGSFTDADPLATTSDYSATITWGDGNTSTVGAAAFSANGSGGFDVTAGHTYTEAGVYAVQVVIHDTGSAQTTVNNVMLVADASLSVVPPAPLFAGPTVGVGATPDAVFDASLDNLGTHYLLAANYYGNSITVLQDDGNGNFTAIGSYGVGAGPNGFAVGDFNGDGKNDVAVGDFASNQISILLGNGDGTLQSAVNYGTGANPANVTAIGYFNNDSFLDLATANMGDGTVSVLMGNGDGTFQTAVNYGAGAGALGVVAGDFNHDGYADLAVANYYASTVSILFNNGNGTYASPVVYGVGANPWFIAAGNLNADGNTDIVTANWSDGVSVLLGNANGTFQTAVDYAAGSLPTGVAIGDLNGDGIADLAVSNYGSGNVSILLGNGNGTFESATNFAAGSGPNGIALADFNGDGRLDIAIANQDSNNVSILSYHTIEALQGQAFSSVLATVLDANAFGSSADLRATIHWGDGTTTTVGAAAFSSNGSGGFNLTAGHTYATSGLFDAYVDIWSVEGSTVRAQFVVRVS